jgi:hypothetical protein
VVETTNAAMVIAVPGVRSLSRSFPSDLLAAHDVVPEQETIFSLVNQGFTWYSLFRKKLILSVSWRKKST